MISFQKLAFRGRFLIVLVFAVQILFVLGLASVVGVLLGEIEDARHARKVLISCYKLSNQEMQFALATMNQYKGRKYFDSSKGKADYLKSADSLKRELRATREIIAKKKIGLQLMDELESEVDNCISLGRKTIDKFYTQRQEKYSFEALELFGSLDKVSKHTARLIDKFESVLKYSPELQASHREQVKSLVLWGIFGNFGIAFAVFYLAFVRVTKRLSVTDRKAQAILERKELGALEPGADEIYELESSLHQLSGVLQERREQHKRVIEGASSMIFTIDNSGQIKSFNGACSRMLLVDDLSSRSILDFIDSDRKEQILSDIESGALTVGMLNSTGEKFHTIWSVYPTGDDDYRFCIVHDISDLERAQESLRVSTSNLAELIDSLSVGIITASSEGIIASVNSKALDLFSSTSEELLGKSVDTLFKGFSRSELVELFEQYNTDSIRLIGVGVHDSEFYADVTAARGIASTGSVYVLSIENVNKRVNLLLYRDYYMHMMRSVVHNFLVGLSQSLARKKDSPELKAASPISQKIDEVAKNIDMLTGLISRFLSSNAIATEDILVEPVSCNISEILNDAVRAVKGLADEKNVSIEQTVEDRKLVLDRYLLTQVVTNLLSNAIKYSEPGMKVELVGSFDKGSLRVEVKDTGPGIEKSDLDHLFERFVQDSPSQDKKHGSGFGLYICKRIIDSMGGELKVESKLGKGSCFYFEVLENETT